MTDYLLRIFGNKSSMSLTESHLLNCVSYSISIPLPNNRVTFRDIDDFWLKSCVCDMSFKINSVMHINSKNRALYIKPDEKRRYDQFEMKA